MSKVSTDRDALRELLSRGVVETIVQKDLEEELSSGRKLRVKLGIDPTSPHLHIGRAIPLLKLRDFQELGHQVVLIVGDFTAVIGDTSDKDAERPMLAREVIEENFKTYKAQAGKLIDLSQAEFRYNSEWLDTLTYREIGEHADLFSVSDFTARENIKRRLDAGKRVSLREVLYPLMQGYDSVAVRADVELGGTDQKFNLLAGRVLQEKYGQKPQNILMNPLIEGPDERKMSSSWGNTIALTAAPNEMYGKIMSMVDSQIVNYFELCTRVPLSDVSKIRSELEGGTLHPKEAKMYLAREIVTLYHSAQAAQGAEAHFVTTFSEKGVPEDVRETGASSGELLCDVLLREGVVASKTECRRLIEDGAVLDATSNLRIAEVHLKLTQPLTVKVGKRRFLKINLSS
jgi:tyrosyl-tRNA synthetase